jgi:hypothetical protein
MSALNRLFIAALLGAFLQPATSAQGFSGTSSNGTSTGSGTFTYDTGNGAGTFLDQGTGAATGLGTANPDGTFTPTGTPGTLTANNGAITAWCFPGIKICVKDSNGKECCFTETVYVVKNQVGANKTLNTNLLSATWINGVKACLSGAGSGAKGYWNPGWTPPTVATGTTSTTNTANGQTEKAVGGATSAPSGGGVKNGNFIHKSASNFTFVPKSVAAELKLPIVGTLDIAEDAQTILALESSNIHGSGQTVFEVAQVGSIDLGIGPTLSGNVLLIDDVDSSLGVLGADFMDKHYLYANGALAQAQDMLAYCAGAAYPYGAGCAGSGGFVPFLGVDGCMSPGGSYTLSIEKGLGGKPALLVVGISAVDVGFSPGCSLLVDPLFVLSMPLFGSAPGGGEIHVDVTVPLNLPPMVIMAQAVVLDPGAPKGVAFSNGVEVVME